MKTTVAIVLLTIVSALGFAQPKVDAIPQSNGAVSSNIANTIVFTDSFNTDLSAWIQYGGTWIIQNKNLYANYGIGCGSVGCAQADLILNDQYQPTGDWKTSIYFTRATDPSYPTFSAAHVQFALYQIIIFYRHRLLLRLKIYQTIMENRCG